MRYLSCFLLTFLLTLAGCQLTPETSARVEDTLGRVATHLDRDQDGIITNPEVRGGIDPNNPMNWLALLGTVAGLFGVTIGRKAQGQVDELYDRTHAPVVKQG